MAAVNGHTGSSVKLVSKSIEWLVALKLHEPDNAVNHQPGSACEQALDKGFIVKRVEKHVANIWVITWLEESEEEKAKNHKEWVESCFLNLAHDSFNFVRPNPIHDTSSHECGMVHDHHANLVKVLLGWAILEYVQEHGRNRADEDNKSVHDRDIVICLVLQVVRKSKKDCKVTHDDKARWDYVFPEILFVLYSSKAKHEP